MAALMRPAWAGLSRGVVRLGLAGATCWWAFGTWLFWGYRPLYDDVHHYDWARWWVTGELVELASNWPGTLIRPYVYHAFVGAVGLVAPVALDLDYTRLAMSVVQVVTFVGVAFRLAGAVAPFGRDMSRAAVVGLLCAPFAVLTNGEVLSESISLSIAGMAVAFACPVGRSPVARLGNVVGVLACLAFLAMTRSAHVPMALAAAGTTLLVLAVRLARACGREAAVALWLACVGMVGWVVVLAPQAALMWKHSQLVPNDPTLWGVGDGQLLWSQRMGKYATVVASCPGVPVAGVAYPVPFADGTAATGRLAWYLGAPHVAAWHLFQALNWDFPTTYVSTFNPLVTVPLNAVGLGVAVVGCMTLVRHGRAAITRLVRGAPVLGVVLAAIAGLWLQTAFTAVETRFGIIPWSALSVAATWGATRWWERLRRGGGSWVPATSAALATGILLLVSRLSVASVPAFQQLEAAGCWW